MARGDVIHGTLKRTIFGTTAFTPASGVEIMLMFIGVRATDGTATNVTSTALLGSTTAGAYQYNLAQAFATGNITVQAIHSAYSKIPINSSTQLSLLVAQTGLGVIKTDLLYLGIQTK